MRNRNKNDFSPDAKVVIFCRFGDRQACKTPVLGEIQITGSVKVKHVSVQWQKKIYHILLLLHRN